MTSGSAEIVSFNDIKISYLISCAHGSDEWT